MNGVNPLGLGSEQCYQVPADVINNLHGRNGIRHRNYFKYSDGFDYQFPASSAMSEYATPTPPQRPTLPSVLLGRGR